MSNDELVSKLRRHGFVDDTLAAVFRSVDRQDFVPDDMVRRAYDDEPLPIGENQTISQPSTVAFMLSLLGVAEGDNVLDVGCGSGYTTALLAEIVGDTGLVKGLEIRDSLVSFGRKNLDRYAYENAHVERAREGVLGDPNNTYDRVLVSAAATKFPEVLLDQVRDNGVIVIPVKDEIWRVRRTAEEFEACSIDRYQGFRFVPLVTP
jgi:protein-L-isoaspartate(D-aspartate) O-methyltransferase